MQLGRGGTSCSDLRALSEAGQKAIGVWADISYETKLWQNLWQIVIKKGGQVMR
jgi:hypothetical protein